MRLKVGRSEQSAVPRRAQQEVVDRLCTKGMGVVELAVVLRLDADRVEERIDGVSGGGLHTRVMLVADVHLILGGRDVVNAEDLQRLVRVGDCVALVGVGACACQQFRELQHPSYLECRILLS